MTEFDELDERYRTWEAVGYVDVQKLLPMREIVRTREENRRYFVSSSEDRRTAMHEGWDKLKAEIAENGITEPVMIEYNPETGYASLTEGNHRVGIAADLGRARVPAVVVRSSLIDRNYRGAVKVASPFEGRKEGVPLQFNPREIGLTE